MRQRSRSSTRKSPPSRSPRAKSPKRVTKASKADAQEKAKWAKWWLRGWTTLVMLAVFAGILYVGHAGLVVFVVFIAALGFREIQNIGKYAKAHEPLWKNYYWFVVAVFGVVSRTVVRRFRTFFTTHPLWLVRVVSRYHRFVTFNAALVGFVTFVLMLRKGSYKAQFRHLAWTIMAILFIVVQCSFWVANILEGIFWMVFPASLIICNDCTAYIFGFFFGRTPLIRLSPKKTWEGFIGAAVSTFVWALLASSLFARYNELTCPLSDGQAPNVWSVPKLQSPCTPHSAFRVQECELGELLDQVGLDRLQPLLPPVVSMRPIVLHSIAFAAFASLVAPFGGFFASGLKRAFDIKDFASLIPGHGGVLDRMDCQLMMGTFTYVWYNSFIVAASVQHVINLVSTLSQADQLVVLERLQATLGGNSTSAP